MCVPQTHGVAVSTTRQEPPVGRPAEAAHVQRATLQRVDVELGETDVIVVNGARLRGRGEEVCVWVPGEAVDPGVVCIVHPANQLASASVPQLHKFNTILAKVSALHSITQQTYTHIHTLHVQLVNIALCPLIHAHSM